MQSLMMLEGLRGEGGSDRENLRGSPRNNENINNNDEEADI